MVVAVRKEWGNVAGIKRHDAELAWLGRNESRLSVESGRISASRVFDDASSIVHSPSTYTVPLVVCRLSLE